MSPELEAPLAAAKTAKPTPEQMKQQRRSFVFGNTALENDLITRDMVDRQAEELARDNR
jgi:hypothetical protein